MKEMLVSSLCWVGSALWTLFWVRSVLLIMWVLFGLLLIVVAATRNRPELRAALCYPLTGGIARGVQVLGWNDSPLK